MVASLRINIRGLDKLQRNFNDPQVVARPVRRFLLRSGEYLHPRVQRRIPASGRYRYRSGRLGYRRTGRGRASVQMLMDSAPVPRWVKIFSTLHYIRFFEFGGKRQRARRPFKSTLRRSRRAIFQFAKEAGQEIARLLVRK